MVKLDGDSFLELELSEMHLSIPETYFAVVLGHQIPMSMYGSRRVSLCLNRDAAVEFYTFIFWGGVELHKGKPVLR